MKPFKISGLSSHPGDILEVLDIQKRVDVTSLVTSNTSSVPLESFPPMGLVIPLTQLL